MRRGMSHAVRAAATEREALFQVGAGPHPHPATMRAYCRGWPGGGEGRRRLEAGPPALASTPSLHDMKAREVGGGRAPRQPGQVRKEAAATSFRSGCCPASHPPRTAAAAAQELPPRMSGLLEEDAALPEPPPSGPGLFGDAPAAPAAAAPYRVLARK